MTIKLVNLQECSKLDRGQHWPETLETYHFP
jgi:hypothetical protein